MEYVNIALISLAVFLVAKGIMNYIGSNRPPRKLLKLAELDINDMKLVSSVETETEIVEEYTDGKHTIKNYRLKPLGNAVKKDIT